MTTIKLKNGSGAPTAGDLAQGEPALDLTNKRLYTEDSGGTVIEVGTNPGVDVTFADNRKAIFGAGSDLQIYHDGSNSYIDDAGTGTLRIRGHNQVRLTDASDNIAAIFKGDAESTLYHNNSAKLATTATGIDVTGTVTADGGTIVSTGSDAFSSKAVGGYAIQAYQDATSSGHTALDLRSDATTGTRYLIRGYKDAAGTPTEVFSVGADGTVTADGLTVDGNVGVGTDSPETALHLYSTGNTIARITSGTSSIAGLDLGDTAGTDVGRIRYDNSNNSLAFTVATNEVMRIDSSGNVGIGTSLPEVPLHVKSTAAGAMTTFESTGNSASSGPNIRLWRNSDSPANGDGLSRLIFQGMNSADERLDYVEIQTEIENANDGVEDGLFQIETIVAGTSRNRLRVNGTESVFNDGGRDLDFRVESDANEHMLFVDAGNNAVGIGQASPTSPLHVKSGANNDNSIITIEGATNNIFELGYATAGAFLNSAAGDPIVFRINETERMRLDASGNFMVGLTSEPTANQGGVFINPTGYIKTSRSGTSAKTHIQFFNDNGAVGSITTSASATTYNTSSDQRLKDNIVDAPSASDDIDAIQVRSFDWKADGSHQKYGMVAQELNTVAPEAVSTPEDSEEMMGVDYSKLVPMLVKEIQSLRARVAQLETN